MEFTHEIKRKIVIDSDGLSNLKKVFAIDNFEIKHNLPYVVNGCPQSGLRVLHVYKKCVNLPQQLEYGKRFNLICQANSNILKCDL